MTTLRRTADVGSCDACGYDHSDLPFWQNLDSQGISSHPEWIGMCPEEGEPLAIVQDSEGTEVIVALECDTRKGMSL